MLTKLKKYLFSKKVENKVENKVDKQFNTTEIQVENPLENVESFKKYINSIDITKYDKTQYTNYIYDETVYKNEEMFKYLILIATTDTYNKTLIKSILEIINFNTIVRGDIVGEQYFIYLCECVYEIDIKNDRCLWASVFAEVLNLKNDIMLDYLLYNYKDRCDLYFNRDDTNFVIVNSILECKYIECFNILKKYNFIINADILQRNIHLVTALRKRDNVKDDILIEFLNLVDHPEKLILNVYDLRLTEINMKILLKYNIEFTRNSINNLIFLEEYEILEILLSQRKEMVNYVTDKYKILKRVSESFLTPIYWDLYPNVYNLIKRLYIECENKSEDRLKKKEVIKRIILNHDKRKSDIIKIVKEVIYCEDVVKYVFTKFI